ncbi:zinc-binding dehydrogenase, partial [Rhizobiaceae sp. 2RAB30]
LKALVDETYTLENAAEAFARVEERRVLGKVLVRP